MVGILASQHVAQAGGGSRDVKVVAFEWYS